MQDRFLFSSSSIAAALDMISIRGFFRLYTKRFHTLSPCDDTVEILAFPLLQAFSIVS
jgi:hypothetical protein